MDQSPEANVTAYTVTYEVTGEAPETADYTDPRAYIKGQTADVLDAPKSPVEKEGFKYTFDGWMNGTKKAGKTIDIVDHDVTLTGAWSKEAIKPAEYTVTYHAKDGVTPDATYTDTVTAGSSTTVRGAAADVGTFSVTLSNEISFECPGKEFKGWAETPNGAVKYAPGKEISNIVTNYDLYAVWDDSAVTETKYQLVYIAGSDGFLPGETAQYATSKADPKMYDKDAMASVKYDDADFAITVTDDQTLFIGWTEDSESVGKIYKLGDKIPTLVTEVKMTENKAVYAVYGEDANEDGTPDVYQAKVTYKVVNGWWTDNGTTVLPNKEIVVWFDLYQKVGSTWKIVTPAPKLGDTVPKGHSGQRGYTGAGWFMDDNPNEMESAPDRHTEVTESETLYTFKYVDATHKTDIVDTLNAIVKKEFTKTNNVESGDVTFTAKATITKQEPEVDMQSLPEVEPAGASHTILGTVTLSTKVGTGSFVFARSSLDDVNPADGDYVVEVSEVNGGADNVTYDKRTFIVEITVKDGAVDKDSVQVMSFVDGKELAPVTDGRITPLRTPTPRATAAAMTAAATPTIWPLRRSMPRTAMCSWAPSSACMRMMSRSQRLPPAARATHASALTSGCTTSWTKTTISMSWS